MSRFSPGEPASPVVALLTDEERAALLRDPDRRAPKDGLWSVLLPLTVAQALEPEGQFEAYLDAEGSEDEREDVFLRRRMLRQRILDFFRSERGSNAMPRPSTGDLKLAFGNDAVIAAQVWNVIRFVDAVDRLREAGGDSLELGKREHDLWNEARVLLVTVRPVMFSWDPERYQGVLRHFERILRRDTVVKHRNPSESATLVLSAIGVKPDIVLGYAPAGDLRRLDRYLVTVVFNAGRDLPYENVEIADSRGMERGEHNLEPDQAAVIEPRSRRRVRRDTDCGEDGAESGYRGLGDLVRASGRSRSVVSVEIRKYYAEVGVPVPKGLDGKSIRTKGSDYKAILKRLNAKAERCSYRITLTQLARESGISRRDLVQARKKAAAKYPSLIVLNESERRKLLEECPGARIPPVVAQRVFKLVQEQAEKVLAMALEATMDPADADTQAKAIVDDHWSRVGAARQERKTRRREEDSR